MIKAYLYIRFSTAEQAQGDSEHRQRRLAAEFIRRRSDLELELSDDRVFIDAGVSSYKGENRTFDRQLGKLVASIHSGAVPKGSFLLTESLDRLSREEPKKAYGFFLSLMEREISIATTSPSEAHVYGGEAALVDLISMLVTSERANKESALKSKRIKDAWVSKRADAPNKIITRVCPNWLRPSNDGQRFEIIEGRAAIVREIFSLSETMGYHSIARYLNEKPIPTFTTRSQGWQSSTIAKILSSPSVYGTFQPRSILRAQGVNGPVRRTRPEGLPKENYYPAVVTRSVFDRVQHIKAGRKNSFSGRRGQNASNLFTHIATCGLCGSSMAMVEKGGGPRAGIGTGKYLVCSRGRRGAGCQYHSWPYEALESSFLDYCHNIDLSDVVDTGPEQQRLPNLRRQEAELRGRVLTNQTAIAATMDSVTANGGAVPKALQNYLLKCESEIETAQTELMAVELAVLDEERTNQTRQVFSEMFENVKEQMAKASGPDLFHLRSRLQNAIRHAVTKMVLRHVPKKKSDGLRAGFKGCPKITHQYGIHFRVGVMRTIYFHKRTPVLVVDNELAGEHISVYRVATEGGLDCVGFSKINNPDYRMRKGDEGKWRKVLAQTAADAGNG